MSKESSSKAPVPEFRRDLITGEWVIVAPNRNRRPHEFIKPASKRIPPPAKKDPFIDPQSSGNATPSFVWPERGDWQVQIFENKYPALFHDGDNCPQFKNAGPYETGPSLGYHELVVTRDRVKTFPKLKFRHALAVFEGVRERYQFFSKDKCMRYAIMFHNWGASAGASVFHPHYQLVGLPLIPPEVERAIAGAHDFYKKHHRYAYSTIIDIERQHKSRIVFENKDAIAFTRFASKEPFDVRIFPKKHLPYFADTDDSTLAGFVKAVQATLSKVERRLKDPDYNFYLHSAPLQSSHESDHYHWHLDIIPRIGTLAAGFEVGTGVEVTIIDPDDAARILNGKK